MTVPIHNRAKLGFTIAELLIAMAVFAILSAMAFPLLISGMRYSTHNTDAILANSDSRELTSEISDVATYSNFGMLFESYTDLEILEDGKFGDMLVFVFRDPTDSSKTVEIVGYFRESPGAGQPGPLKKFVIGSNLIDNTEKDSWNVAQFRGSVDHETIIDDCLGLGPDDALFENFSDSSYIIRGNILRDTNVHSSGATNTYNYTISPRG